MAKRRPLRTPCDRSYTAYRNSGTRPLTAVTLIVMHDTEGGSASEIARYFSLHEEGVQGSAHLVVDDKDCFRCLRDFDIPWGAPGANKQGFHIEQCAFAYWNPLLWRRHMWMLRRAAYKTALHCHKFHIPPHFVRAHGLARGMAGITTHAEVTKWQQSIGQPGNHTDPGRGWPRILFMTLVRRYYKQQEAQR
jgi:hypothetical protein